MAGEFYEDIKPVVAVDRPADKLCFRARATLAPAIHPACRRRGLVEYRYTPELNQTVTVLPDGFVNLNLVGNVKVSDLTVDQAHDVIVQKAKARLNDPELNLILREFQHPYVVVAGQVTTPGKIELRENTTAMQAILLAGGFLASAQSGQVLLFRKINSDTAEVKVLKLTSIHKTEQLEHDAQLESGDMLLYLATRWRRFPGT